MEHSNFGCSFEGLMLKLKLQYFGHLMWRADSFEKTLTLGKIEGRRRRGRQDEMVGWHHQLNGHGFGWTPGVGDGQGGLECCSSWGHKESDTTEQLNWTVCRRFHKGRRKTLLYKAVCCNTLNAQVRSILISTKKLRFPTKAEDILLWIYEFKMEIYKIFLYCGFKKSGETNIASAWHFFKLIKNVFWKWQFVSFYL